MTARPANQYPVISLSFCFSFFFSINRRVLWIYLFFYRQNLRVCARAHRIFRNISVRQSPFSSKVTCTKSSSPILLSSTPSPRYHNIRSIEDSSSSQTRLQQLHIKTRESLISKLFKHPCHLCASFFPAAHDLDQDTFRHAVDTRIFFSVR